MRFSLLAACVLFAGIQTLSAESVVADFSSTNNPNGSYQYGYESALGLNFALFPDQLSGSGYAGYESATDGTGAAIYGVDGSVASSGTVIFTPGFLNFSPSSTGQLAVLRYTVSSSGLYDVTGEFRGQDSHGVTTDAHVLFNNDLLNTSDFNADVNGTGDPSAQTFDIAGIHLNAGDTIDFALGDGGNGYTYDNTGLQATITETTPDAASDAPEPGSVLLVAAGVISLLALKRRFV